MKRAFLFMTAALIGLAACQNEISPVEKPSGEDVQIKDYPYEMTFTAVGEGSTKTVLNDTKVLWESGDAIKVFWGTGKSNKAVAIPSNAQNEASFTTKVEAAENYYAVYPYNESENMTDDGKISVEIPSVQGGAFRDANIMLAKADDKNTFAFKHLVGLIEFTTDVTGTVEITGATDDILTGTVTVTGFEDDGIPVYTIDEGSKTITIDVVASNTYYAAFLPSAKLNCLSVKLTTTSGDETTTEYALSANSIEMGRGKLVPLGNITGQFGKNLFVKDDADGNGDGKTWETALSYAQVAAMLTSEEVDGKIFNFAAGEYKNDEHIYINKATGDELLKISFKGGYAALSTGTDLTKNDPSANVTTITGADEKRAFRIGRRIDMTVKGVTFSSGNGDGDVDGNGTPDGGGILIADNDSGNSVLTFENCTFSGNTSTSGGALVTKAAKVVLKGCTFSGNTATERGGAIFVNNDGTLEINGGTFTTNEAANEGGVIYCNDDTKVTIANASFSKNTAEAKAGGVIYASSNAVIKLTNTSFTKNQASGDVGGVVYITSNATLDITGGEYNENVAKRGSVIYSSGTGKIAINDAVMNNNTSNNATNGSVFGGAIRILDVTTLEITGGTYSKNYASQKGGFIYCENSTTTSKGKITISSATISENSSGASGGALFINAKLPVVINNAVFSDNTAVTYGGAIINNGSNASTAEYTISNTTFTGNKVTNTAGGGAIYASQGKFTISDCIFDGNEVVESSANGGAIRALNTTQTITDCIFQNNIANNSKGGAIYNDGSTQTFSGCTFENNITKRGTSTYNYTNIGAAIYGTKCTITATDTDFIDNTSYGSGGACNIQGESTATFTGCNFEGNTTNAGGGGAFFGIGAANYTFNSCNFTENESTTGRGGAIWVEKDTPTYKFNMCNFEGNISSNFGTAISVSQNTGQTVYINNTTFKNNKSTNAYDVLDRGTIAAAGKTYLNNCLFYGNHEDNNKKHSSVIFDAENQSTESLKSVGLLINCTIIEAKHDKAVSVDGTYADATIVNNVLLSNSDAALRLGVDVAGNLKSGGYNFFNSYSKKDDTCKYTLASDATEVANATYADGSALFTDQYMWKATPAQAMTTVAALSTWVNANVTGGDAFISWLGTVDGLTKDLAGNSRGNGSIYPGCYQN